MRRRGTRALLIGAGAILALAGATATGAQQDRASRIYRGDLAQTEGIRLMTWGSGEVRETEEAVFIGSRSLKITTHGRYQGARIVLQTPFDLSAARNDPTTYLELTVKLVDRGTTGRPGDFGMMGGPPTNIMRQFGMRGGRGGMMGGPPGAGGQTGTGGSNQVLKPKPLGNLRIVLVSTDDKRVEMFLPLDSAVKVRDEWSVVAVPLTTLKGLKETSGQIKEVLVFGDNPGTLYLGAMRVVRDETPIRVDELPERTIAVNDTVTFTASATAGISPLKYEWDFDATNGVDVDAEGRSVKHTFRKSREGDYVVTLTVRDLYGLKKPVTRRAKVRVTL